MRIPLLSEIRLKHAVLFATVLAVVQLCERTDPVFAALTWAYILLSCAAFNAAGGFIYPSGFWIFFNAMLTAIVALTFKVFLGEPGQSNLRAPVVTMAAYCLGMTMIGLVAALKTRLIPRQGYLADMGTGKNMKKAAIGSLILGLAFAMLLYSVKENGSFFSALKQINSFTLMSIILGTYYQVRKTGGRQSSNWIVWVGGLSLFILGGIVGFSKQGFATPGVAWFLAAVVAGHRFTWRQILGIVCAVAIFQIYLVPYSQAGRNTLLEQGRTLRSDAANVKLYLGDLKGTRQAFLQAEQEIDFDTIDGPHLYDRPQGLLDRLGMIAPDDALIAYTRDGNVQGIFPSLNAVFNLVPHFIWKNKPDFGGGNLYARQLGIIVDDDTTTGISFSPVGDAYHQAEWTGVLILVPLFVFILMMVMDSLSGDIRRSPWGLLFAVTCAHIAPEGMLGGQSYVASYTAFGVVVVALMAKYVLPLLGGVLTNTDRTRVVRGLEFRPVVHPKELPPAPFSS
jgi:hypothetical protein